MVKFPELLPDSVIVRAMKLDVSQLCDGMKKLKVPFSGCMEAVISPVDPFFKVCGTAVTVETIAGDNLPIHVATYTAPAAGYVMVIDGKKYEKCAYIGDKIMGACKAIGLYVYAGGKVVKGLQNRRKAEIALCEGRV